MEGGALDKACNELQALVSGLKPPKQLSKEVGESDNAHRLISCCQSLCCSVLNLSVCIGHVSTALVQVLFALVHLFTVASGHNAQHKKHQLLAAAGGSLDRITLFQLDAPLVLMQSIAQPRLNPMPSNRRPGCLGRTCLAYMNYGISPLVCF